MLEGASGWFPLRHPVECDAWHGACPPLSADYQQRIDGKKGMVVLRQPDPPKVYIYHSNHEHDRTYTENVVEYLEGRGVLCRSIPLSDDGLRPELQLCLDDRASAVLGYNSQLDHSWLASGCFLDAAAREGIPVLQWILDHPSCRWAEFFASNRTNSGFLLNSEQQREYFQAYCLPGAVTAAMGGVGPNRRSRIANLTRQCFFERPIACMIPLSLRRLRSIDENDAAMQALERPFSEAVHDAIAIARYDLSGSLHAHLISALGTRGESVSSEDFNSLCHIVEQSVQTFRRLQVFATAEKYPVLIQSDDSARRFVRGSVATLATNVGMQFTLARIPMCRAVLSVSPISDMIHDRTMNALNGGCVAIAEDSISVKGFLKHRINALLFRYDDDSLDECLDIVCNQPERAHEIARAGMGLREDPRVRFGQFHNILDCSDAMRFREK
jgi:hypothetical protein